MIVPARLTWDEGWRFRLDMPDGLGKYLRRLCRMAYGVHLHAPMRGCHVTISTSGLRLDLLPLVGQSFEVAIPLGRWFHNTNAVWCPVECRELDGLWRLRQEPHLCIGYLTQEATRF